MQTPPVAFWKFSECPFLRALFEELPLNITNHWSNFILAEESITEIGKICKTPNEIEFEPDEYSCVIIKF